MVAVDSYRPLSSDSEPEDDLDTWVPPRYRWEQMVLAAVAGTGTWLVVTSVFGLGSQLTAHYSNNKLLYSNLDLCVQMANISPAFLVLVVPRFTSKFSCELSVGILALGAVAMWSLVFLWKNLVLLLISSAAGGLVGTTSMVTIFQAASAMGNVALRERIIGLSLGIGACGVVSSFIGLAQRGIGESFAIAALLQTIAVIAWGMLMHANRESMSQARLGNKAMEEDDQTSEDMVFSSLSEEDLETLQGGNSFSARSHVRSCIVSLAPYTPELVAIFLSCALQYATPSLLPFLTSHERSLFFITLTFLTMSILGRASLSLVSSRLSWLAYFVLLLVQSAAFGIMVAASKKGSVSGGHTPPPAGTDPPPSASSSPPLSLFVALVLVSANAIAHGMIVTAVFLSTSEGGGPERRNKQGLGWREGENYISIAAVAGLLNQMGALGGAAVSFLWVRLF